MANKEQRKLNRWVRKLNANLAADEFLGINRFSVSMSYKVRNYDNFWVYVYLFKDAKTGAVEEVVADGWNYPRVIGWGINNFIVNIRQIEGW